MCIYGARVPIYGFSRSPSLSTLPAMVAVLDGAHPPLQGAHQKSAYSVACLKHQHKAGISVFFLVLCGGAAACTAL
jgi:hypothetical protein